MLLLKQLLLYTLLCPSIVTAECISITQDQGNNSSVKGIIQEFATVQQRMQSDTYEMLRAMQSDISENLRTMQSDISDNLRIMQSATSVNLQTVMSAISTQSTSADANLVNVIDAVESVSEESRVWRNELSEIMTNMLNQTMDIILKVNSNKQNSSIISNSNRKKLNEEIQHEIISIISNQIMQNFSEIIRSQQSSEISMLRDNLTETNNALAEMKNITAHLVSRMGTSDDDEETQKSVPLGFTKHNDTAFLLPTVFGATTMSWYDSVIRCFQHGAIPFIPRTIEDFKFIQNVDSVINGGNGIWLPASDHAREGLIKWYDGTDASSLLNLFDWQEGYAADNNDDHDCVNIWTSYGHKLEFESCTKDGLWPMICEKR